MHKILKLCAYGLLSFFSLALLVGLADWSARWDRIKGTLDAHPHLAAFVRTPLFMLIPLVLGFAFFWAERKLGLPRIGARLVNGCLVPRLRTVTIGQTFAAANKEPGDQHKNDWDWFLEVALANQSDTPTTIESVEAVVKVRRNILGCKIPSWLPKSRLLPVKAIVDCNDHVLVKKDPWAENDKRIPSLTFTVT